MIDVSMGQGGCSEYTMIATIYQANLLCAQHCFECLASIVWLNPTTTLLAGPLSDKETHNESLSGFPTVIQ